MHSLFSVSNGWTGAIRIIFHRSLGVPQLAAAASDIVLAGGIEERVQSSAILVGNVSGMRALLCHGSLSMQGAPVLVAKRIGVVTSSRGT